MECLEVEKCGGYNAHFLKDLLDEYECPVCKMALREPILTLCGHRLCLSCSEEMKKRSEGVLICPLDKTSLKSEQIFPDKLAERAILQLKVKCDNFSKNCHWTGELKALNNHLTNCEYQEVKCLNEQCDTLLLRKELNDHMEKNCIYRLVTCQYCEQKNFFCENQVHEENCECLPLYCVNQCGMKVFRKEMSSHITDSCANTIVACQYVNIGCSFKGMRKEQENHVNTSSQNHLAMAISKVVALEDKITSTVYALENKITSTVNALENKISSTVDALKNEFISKKDEENHIINLHKENFEIIKKIPTTQLKSFPDDIRLETGVLFTPLLTDTQTETYTPFYKPFNILRDEIEQNSNLMYVKEKGNEFEPNSYLSFEKEEQYNESKSNSYLAYENETQHIEIEPNIFRTFENEKEQCYKIESNSYLSKKKNNQSNLLHNSFSLAKKNNNTYYK